MTLALVLSAVYGGLLIGAAVSDAVSLRIPNVISLALAVLFALDALALGMSLGAILWHLLAGAVVLVVGFGLFAWGKLGGGDVKLMAAVSLWVGWDLVLPLMVVIGFFGGVVTLAVIGLRHTVLADWLSVYGIRSVALETGKGAPYAIAIAAGWFLISYMPVR